MSGLQTATRVVQLLELLAERNSVSLDDASDALGVHKSNALRLLATLRELDWVTSNVTRTEYQLGPKLVAIAQSAFRAEPMQLATRLARAICDRAGETVHISAPVSTSMLIVSRVDTSSSLRVTQDIGQSDPLHATAVGKVYLAWLPEEEAGALIGRIQLPRLTEYTLTSRSALLQGLHHIRDAGYAINIEETELGVNALAFLIQTAPYSQPYALSLTGPATRWTPEQIDRVLPDLLAIVEPFNALRQRGSTAA
jgi:IclR family acetate operon transcriptional repressor